MVNKETMMDDWRNITITMIAAGWTVKPSTVQIPWCWSISRMVHTLLVIHSGSGIA